jgi:hypothetical protein
MMAAIKEGTVRNPLQRFFSLRQCLPLCQLTHGWQMMPRREMTAFFPLQIRSVQAIGEARLLDLCQG